MNKVIYLTPADVPEHLRRGYDGRNLRAEICTTVSIPADAGTWSGGSRETYRGIRISDGTEVPLSEVSSAPWGPDRAERVVTLTPGYAVVMRSMLQGRDLGLTFYLHAADAAPVLPDAEPLTDIQQQVLDTVELGYTRQFYELHQRDITAVQVDEARLVLTQRGLLTKRGGLTAAGRNARST